jgi:hypothetical protein
MVSPIRPATPYEFSSCDTDSHLHPAPSGLNPGQLDDARFWRGCMNPLIQPPSRPDACYGSSTAHPTGTGGGFTSAAIPIASFCRKTLFCCTGPRLSRGNGSGFGRPDGFWIPSLSFISSTVAD